MNGEIIQYGDPLELGYSLGMFPVAGDGVDCRLLKYRLDGQTATVINHFSGFSDDEMLDHLIREAERMIYRQVA